METEIHNYITRQILRDPKRSLKPDQPLISSGLIDSFSLVDLGLFVTDQYGVELSDSELNAQTFDTIAQLAHLVRTRQNA